MGVFILIQFIKPARNENGQVLNTDISNTASMPEAVQMILINACYDCHSNNTRYPWYFNIQPMAWLMASHIKNGKEKLNFSEFGNYPKRKQISRLNEISNQIKDDEMPLSSYKLMHKNARLSQTEKTLIMDWMEKAADNILINK